MIKRVILVLAVALVIFLLYVFLIQPNIQKSNDSVVITTWWDSRLMQSGVLLSGDMPTGMMNDKANTMVSGTDATELSDKDYQDLEGILQDLIKE